MKRITCFLAFLLIFLLFHSACESSRPNFSGEWRFDPERSNQEVIEGLAEMHQGLTIRHDADSIIVENTLKSKSGKVLRLSEKYITDGLQRTEDRETGSELVLSRWKGRKLEIIRTYPNSKPSIETWRLSRDGRTLTVTGIKARGTSRIDRLIASILDSKQKIVFVKKG